MAAKAILFNGPPRSGKDTAGDAVRSAFTGTMKVKFSDPLKDGVHGLYGFHGVSVDYFEDTKDLEQEDLLGYTPRQAYIDLSENYVKPCHGKDAFGKIATRRMARKIEEIEDRFDPIFVVPDLGFVEEAIPVRDLLGAENVLTLQLFREGKTFAGDSRNYVDLYGVKTIKVLNDDLETFKRTIQRIVRTWLTNPGGII